MRIAFTFFGLILINLFIPSVSYANLLINEVSTFDTDDWVEIYNDGETAVDLSLYEIRDVTSTDGTNKTKLSGSISAKGFIVYDLGNKLNKDGDNISLYLVSPSETKVDSIPFGDKGGVCAPESNTHTIGRVVDGGNTIERFASSSKGLTNIGVALLTCPTPTTKPTSTSTPTVMPTNTQTPMPTYTNTPTRVPTKTSTPTPSNEDNSPTQSAGSVIGVSDENKTEKTDKKEVSEAVSTQKNFAPYFLIGSGIIFIGVSAFLLIKKYKNVS